MVHICTYTIVYSKCHCFTGSQYITMVHICTHEIVYSKCHCLTVSQYITMVHNGVMMHYNVNYVQQYTVQRSLWNFRCFLMNRGLIRAPVVCLLLLFHLNYGPNSVLQPHIIHSPSFSSFGGG